MSRHMDTGLATRFRLAQTQRVCYGYIYPDFQRSLQNRMGNAGHGVTSLKTVFCCVIAALAVTANGALVDPVIDDPNREWCYLAKSTTVLGVPFVPEPVQVTYDGAIYTRN